MNRPALNRPKLSRSTSEYQQPPPRPTKLSRPSLRRFNSDKPPERPCKSKKRRSKIKAFKVESSFDELSTLLNFDGLELEKIMENHRNTQQQQKEHKKEQKPKDPNLKSIHFKQRKFIAAGSFGIVCSVSMLKKSEFCNLSPPIQSIYEYESLALKINKEALKKSNNFLTEIRILSRLQSIKYHKNICKFLCFGFDESERLHQIFEYYANGTLQSFLECHGNGNGNLNLFQQMQILIQIANGLIHIHKNEIVHLDIKPENIFIDFDAKRRIFLFRIGDFGISADLLEGDAEGSNNECIKLQSGDPIYIAPEILQSITNSYRYDGNKENVKKIDVFSLGVIGLEMLFDCKLPSQGSLFSYIRSIGVAEDEIDWHRFGALKALNEKESKMENKMKRYLHKMLIKEPMQRISAIDLMEFVKNDFGDSYSEFLSESFDEILKCQMDTWTNEECVDRSFKHIVKDLFVFDVDITQTFEPAAAGYRDFVDFTLEHSRKQMNTAFLFA